MKVLLLGVGDAFTSRSFGSSALIEGPDGWLLLDCPDLIHRALLEATTAVGWKVGADDIDDIIITHLHGDHCNGLESFGFHRAIGRRSDPSGTVPRVHTNAPSAERLWERLAPAMDAPMGSDRRSALADYYDLRVIEPSRESTISGLSVRCRFTGHPIPTTGLLISDGHHTLGWSSDTPWEDGHFEWLAGADLIVHEANRGPAHTPIERLNALPDDVRSRIRLIHLPDDFDGASTDIEILRAGQILDLAAVRVER